MKKETAELAVIGAGPGGYAAAFLAADLAIEAVLIDPEPYPGGVCLYRGCIPSKALLHVAKVMKDALEAAAFGVKFADPRVDLEALRSWKEEVVAKQVRGLGILSRNRKVHYIRGLARFVDAGQLEVETGEGDRMRLSFRHAVLATGSSPADLQGMLSNRSDRIMDSTGALQLNAIPERLLVVGGGYIGLELGSIYAALGSRVSLVEMRGGLLSGIDRDLVRVLSSRLKNSFESILLNTTISRMEETTAGVRVVFERADSAPEPREFDRVLVSVGRKPNSDNVGLENTAVKVGPDGFVRVNGQRRTEEPRIYAIGDVAGPPMLAHKATHEGRTAVEAIAGRKVVYDPRAVPAVVFTDPEIAWCGLTEEQARSEKRGVRIVRFPWSASGRAATQNRPEGVTKLVLDPEAGSVLGVGIAGSGAGELIAEGVLAVEMGAGAEDLSLSIHPHPTLSETIMEAAAAFFGHSTHLYRPRKRED